MGDSAEFEKLSALEARLREAFDRIATGARTRAAPPDISEALEQAQARVAKAEEMQATAEAARAAAEEARAAADEAADAARNSARGLRERIAVLEGDLVKARAREADAKTRADDLQDRLTASETDLKEQTEQGAKAEARIGELEARVGELEAELANVASMPDQSAEIAHLERRVKRARAERDAMVAARDAAQDAADELAETMGKEPDARVVTLRGEVRRLRMVVDQMAAELNALREAPEGRGVDGVNRALEAQVAALTEARRAEAAELDRILSELSGKTGNGGGASHA